MADSDAPSVEELTQKLIMAEEVSKGLLLDHQAEKEEMIMWMKALEEMVQSLSVTARGGDRQEDVAPSATGGGGDSAQPSIRHNLIQVTQAPHKPHKLIAFIFLLLTMKRTDKLVSRWST